MNVRTPTDIALLVRERRRKLRVSQQGLARRIDASRQWVQKLEQGRPGLELGLTLRALAALGLSLDAREPAAGAIAVADPAGRNGLSLRATASVSGHSNATAAARKPAPGAPAHDAGPSEDRARSLLLVDLNSIVSGNRSGVATQAPPAPVAAPRRDRR